MFAGMLPNIAEAAPRKSRAIPRRMRLPAADLAHVQWSRLSNAPLHATLRTIFATLHEPSQDVLRILF
jgi:hypothetical protein